VAVARAIVDTGDGAALMTDQIVNRVAAAEWEPVCFPYRLA
jgi:hypothetical protein